ncbi:hypothetical protein MRX96_000479 [Rhipicephalus microplus]
MVDTPAAACESASAKMKPHRRTSWPDATTRVLIPTKRLLTPRHCGWQLALNSVASKQPRLLSDALKLIVRPRGGFLLSKITDFQLFEAVCAAENFAKASIRADESQGFSVIRGVDLRLDHQVFKQKYKILVTLPSLTSIIWETPPSYW